ncbi:coproporphyrinogen III oxidase [Edaphobacillus lindanitolerans]|uniref:Oxygen-independent coproporphyrinogen-3 oxidase n=1 Tax=Edaphobacillus lindanitolerans TaxID=550447 RepID=A0A1U7PS77_9BACI|nr:coproporphyrinogen III oxidase [Edaphobacillus lindanitolerans]SIT90834.1 oxygen-independent coproporphyrinogen-3 oxidase [Edaphobacillus lindanitolerans]
MKPIDIEQQFEQDWVRMFQNIANLFFEETEMTLGGSASDESAVRVSFAWEEDAGTLRGRADLRDGADTFSSDYREEAVHSGDPKDGKRQLKRVLSHVFLDVLEQSTGIIQPWGILTGMRPTKLYHKMRREGLSHDEISERLVTEYRISPEKIELMKRIVDRQLKMIPDLDRIGEEVSVYIGIPFCPTKCAYCTFPAYAIPRRGNRVQSFLDGLHVEIEEIGAWLKERGVKVTSVYFGGGTPTSIEAHEMDALYEKLFAFFPDIREVREITVEAGRPDTITPEKINVLKKWDIDRISVNPQSYTDETLKAIGRFHTVQETIDKFHLSRDMGMNNINMDLIIGLPNEGTEEFAHSLAETEKLQPESLTVHTLSFKRASEMTRNKKKYKVADRGTVVKMMNMAEDWTAGNGYVPYYLYRQKNILGNLENVGYSKPGEESIYNIVIMEEVQTIIGLGCGASSKFVHPQTGRITQFHNPKDPAAYILSYSESIDKKIEMLDGLFGEPVPAK